MNHHYQFYIAGRARNKENILTICNTFEELNISHYCFLKNEKSHKQAGLDLHDDHLAETFESLELESPSVRILFENDLKGIKSSEKFLLVLPAGKSAHIEAGIAYGLGKKCYAVGEYEVTDSLYLIFDHIFKDENELKLFLSNQSV
ncbi:hypothetical protein [Beduini massiliensis]|uniref:hypothetical protein n=1 Tax=Beduini massiliensis TaxID=1585974 RepID=UPI00059A8E19|nr:hypothetical protein [Beduini massiliensis]